MLDLSPDPKVARDQLQGLIAYLLTFCHIDGEFDDAERRFVTGYLHQVIAQHVHSHLRFGTDQERAERQDKYRGWLQDLIRRVDADIARLLGESVAWGERQSEFVHKQLTVRCYEVFQRFDRKGQAQLVAAIDDLRVADDFAHPAEIAFRNNLLALIRSGPSSAPPLELGETPRLTVSAAAERMPQAGDHPWLDALERPLPKDPSSAQAALDRDMRLVEAARRALAELRERGKGRLDGVNQAGWLAGRQPFLSQRVYVRPLQSSQTRYDITVLGDLHGCYSSLKAALIQSGFLTQLATWEAEPDAGHPEPLLVCLGNYIDRGRFGFDGVIRALLTLCIRAPENVILLAGPHERLGEEDGRIHGGTIPASSVDAMADLDHGALRQYKRLFDGLPGALLLDEILFTHGGIPREVTVKARLNDLASLDHPDIAEELLWSSPSPADIIPAPLQRSGKHFAFGRLQAQAFLQRLGCHSLIRGGLGEDGFQVVYDDGRILTLALSSAGGPDLPATTGQAPQPWALTLAGSDGRFVATPWPIAAHTFAHPDHNGFYR